MNFSWISSAEAPKFVEVATDVIEKVREVGPLSRLVKGRAKVV